MPGQHDDVDGIARAAPARRIPELGDEHAAEAARAHAGKADNKMKGKLAEEQAPEEGD